MLLGLVHPTGGTFQLLDTDPATRPTPTALRRIGALIEEPAFWDHLTGRRNLLHFARAAGPVGDRRAREQRITDVLATVDLTGDADRKVRTYSQGMRQRLGLARALLGDPELLVLDEPTNGLDPQGIAEIRGLLRRLVDAGATVFVSSHLLAEVEVLCDRVAVIADGRLVAEGAPSALRPDAGYLRVVVDRPDDAAPLLLAHPDVTHVERSGTALRVRLTRPEGAAEVNRSLVQAGFAVAALTPERARLEDVYLDLTSPGPHPLRAASDLDAGR